MARLVLAPCCCDTTAGRVLFWFGGKNASSGHVFASQVTSLKTVYEDMGLTVHNDDDWTGVIYDYGLIFLFRPEHDPEGGIYDSWWPDVRDGLWPGRICVVGENELAYTTSVWITDNVTPITGITFIASFIANDPDDVPPDPFTVTREAEPLMAGVGGDWNMDLSSETSGGVLLSVADGFEWLTHEVVGITDWVISGDFNHLDNIALGYGTDNIQFAENLWNVPV